MLILIPVERVVIEQVHILWDWDVEEQETFTLGWIRRFDLVILLTEPCDLVRVSTAPTTAVQAVISAGIKEPETESDVLTLLIIYRELVVECM